jgi:hypothetical protein
MFRIPKHLVLPSYIAYLITCFHFVVTKHDSSTRKNEALVQNLSHLACLHDSFLLTKSLKNKSLLDGVVYTRYSGHHLTESQFVAHYFNLLYLSHNSTFELCMFSAVPNKDDIISHLVHIENKHLFAIK